MTAPTFGSVATASATATISCTTPAGVTGQRKHVLFAWIDRAADKTVSAGPSGYGSAVDTAVVRSADTGATDGSGAIGLRFARYSKLLGSNEGAVAASVTISAASESVAAVAWVSSDAESSYSAAAPRNTWDVNNAAPDTAVSQDGSYALGIGLFQFARTNAPAGGLTEHIDANAGAVGPTITIVGKAVNRTLTGELAFVSSDLETPILTTIVYSPAAVLTNEISGGGEFPNGETIEAPDSSTPFTLAIGDTISDQRQVGVFDADGLPIRNVPLSFVVVPVSPAPAGGLLVSQVAETDAGGSSYLREQAVGAGRYTVEVRAADASPVVLNYLVSGSSSGGGGGGGGDSTAELVAALNAWDNPQQPRDSATFPALLDNIVAKFRNYLNGL